MIPSSLAARLITGCLLTLAAIWLSPSDGNPGSNLLRAKESTDDWERLEEDRLTSREIILLGVHDHWRWTYRHRATGMLATVTWLRGECGPLVSHQPDVCYRHEALCSDGRATTWKHPGSNDQFRIQSFRGRSISSHSVTVLHAWSTGDGWAAPAYPRLSFAMTNQIQRMQISLHHPTAGHEEARNAIKQLTDTICARNGCDSSTSRAENR